LVGEPRASAYFFPKYLNKIKAYIGQKIKNPIVKMIFENPNPTLSKSENRENPVSFYVGTLASRK
jgi:hypothetical protein